MQTPVLIPFSHEQRLHQILDLSWKIFKSQFLYGRHLVLTEAPFQHHFANIISTVGNLYCIDRDDTFIVDLETKCENIKGKTKYIDITCTFANSDVKCAIELKFKTAQQGAQENGRVDAYVDIEALEHACQKGYTFGQFYMITDSTTYVHQSHKGVGTIFSLHHGFYTQPGQKFTSDSQGRNGIVVTLEQQYTFEWETANGWYFLAVPVN